MQRYTSENEFLGAIDVETINTVIGVTSFSVSRADLQEVLLQKATELKISIVYNHHVKELIFVTGKTTLIFDNNTSSTPDIVIGADGRMNSEARKYVIGESKPIYQGFVN
jgi:FAD-dependent urate hydroxylase